MNITKHDSKPTFTHDYKTTIPNLEERLIDDPQSFLDGSDDFIAYIFSHYKHVFKSTKHEKFLLKVKKETKFIFLKSVELLTDFYETKKPENEFYELLAEHKNFPEFLPFLQKILTRKNDVFAVKTQILNCDPLLKVLAEFLDVEKLQYRTLLIFWILSFERNHLKFFRINEIHEKILDVLNGTEKENVQRICFSILNNAYEFNFKFSIRKTNILQKKIENVLLKTNDEELNEILPKLNDKLAEIQKRGGTLSNYFCELFENKLDETKCHYDHAFWDINIDRIMKKKIEIIKALKKYLKSHVPKIVCIASNDIHMLLKHAPEAYYYVDKFRIKEDLVKLSLSTDEDIRYHSTQALTSCIFAQWGLSE